MNGHEITVLEIEPLMANVDLVESFFRGVSRRFRMAATGRRLHRLSALSGRRRRRDILPSPGGRGGYRAASGFDLSLQPDADSDRPLPIGFGRDYTKTGLDAMRQFRLQGNLSSRADADKQLKVGTQSTVDAYSLLTSFSCACAGISPIDCHTGTW